MERLGEELCTFRSKSIVRNTKYKKIKCESWSRLDCCPRGGFSSVPHGGQNGAAEQHFRGLGLRDGDRRRFFGGGVL